MNPNTIHGLVLLFVATGSYWLAKGESGNDRIAVMLLPISLILIALTYIFGETAINFLRG